jgi:hypothetical protein
MISEEWFGKDKDRHGYGVIIDSVLLLLWSDWGEPEERPVAGSRFEIGALCLPWQITGALLHRRLSIPFRDYVSII